MEQGFARLPRDDFDPCPLLQRPLSNALAQIANHQQRRVTPWTLGAAFNEEPAGRTFAANADERIREKQRMDPTVTQGGERFVNANYCVSRRCRIEELVDLRELRSSLCRFSGHECIPKNVGVGREQLEFQGSRQPNTQGSREIRHEHVHRFIRPTYYEAIERVRFEQRHDDVYRPLDVAPDALLMAACDPALLEGKPTARSVLPGNGVANIAMLFDLPEGDREGPCPLLVKKDNSNPLELVDDGLERLDPWERSPCHFLDRRARETSGEKLTQFTEDEDRNPPRVWRELRIEMILSTLNRRFESTTLRGWDRLAQTPTASKQRKPMRLALHADWCRVKVDRENRSLPLGPAQALEDLRRGHGCCLRLHVIALISSVRCLKRRSHGPT
jgi:hypothetical protein